MKKTLAAVALGAAVTISCIPLTACSGEYSETYKGTVSEATYTSKDDAVTGYLETEISGKTTKAVLVDYKVESELSGKEIDKLELGEEYTADLQKVEKMSVEYKEESTPLAAVAYEIADSSETTTRTLYVLSYTAMFRFFTPAVKEGESLSASYYDSTFEAEKYVNCTMNAEIKSTMSYDDKTMTLINTALAKVTEDSLYELDKVSYEGNMPGTFTGGEFGGMQDLSQEFYATDTTDGIYAARKEIGQTEFGKPMPVYYYKTVNDYFMTWFDQRFGRLDHTFFEKTSTGYALKKDKFAQFASNQSIFQNGLSADNATDFEYIINIKDGRMADVTISVTYIGSENTMSIEFSDFGTTEIIIPDEIKAKLPA